MAGKVSVTIEPLNSKNAMLTVELWLNGSIQYNELNLS